MRYVIDGEKNYMFSGAIIGDKKIYRSKRIETLRNYLLNQHPAICAERAVIVTQTYKECEGEHVLIKRARSLANVLEKMTIFILDNELLVGNQASAPRSAPVFPEFSINWLIDELNGKPKRPDQRTGDRFIISKEHEAQLREIANFWSGKTHADICNARLTDTIHKVGKAGVVDSYWLMNGADGHLTVNLKRVVYEGLDSFKKQVQEKLYNLDLSIPEQAKQRQFLLSCIILCDAIVNFAHRYADLAESMAIAEENDIRKAELLKIADVCRHVPEFPARDFHEALQAYYFINLVIQIENNGHSYSFGRMDKTLYPIYERDIKNNVITSEDAIELLECFFLKLFQLNKIFTYDNQKAFSGYQLFQNITIGGQDADGRDVTNDLSYHILETQAAIRLHMPSVSVRYHDKISDRFLNACLDCIKLGGGQPAIYSDEIYIASLMNRGMRFEDAVEYSIVGCVEAVAEGKCGHRPNGSGLINLGKILEMSLNKGIDPRTGICPHSIEGDLSTFKSFGEVFDSVKELSRFYIKQQVIWDNIIDQCTEGNIGDPLVSMLVDDCIERGMTIKEGGAVYDYAGPEFIGVTNVANSLAAIKKLVFDEKVLTGAQLKHALITNYEDMTTSPTGPEIRQMLLAAPKYGNDDDYVDSIAVEYFRFICEEIVKYKTTRHGRGPIGAMWQPSTSTISCNVPFGAYCGATPDGRVAGEPLCVSVSPMHNTDISGYTAVLKSVSKLPTILVSGGQLLNMKLNPSSIDKPSGRQKFIALLRTFLGDLKGMHIQFNIIDSSILKDAQEHPENYKDLMVRVAGYSALFTPLDKSLQDDIIGRTEHVL